MNRFSIALVVFLFAFGCSRDNYDTLDSYVVGEIVSFNLNCSTCILTFPNDSLTIKHDFGASRDNYYQTINLMKDTFKINQKVLVKLRKAEENELRACITLYPSYDYINIYITNFKSVE
ncbi:MAG TPA: hypothetical protein VFC65_19320 [Prolixibacteraceae bacterium]|nr:hypothetical protein [Prolixibacteraceae bacterium]